MRVLRELYNKATQGEWYHEDGILYSFEVEKDSMIGETDNNDAFLIAAMHNALPELLDAWEMVQKIDEWAKTPSGIQSAVTLGGYQYAQFDVEKMIRQWREAPKNERVE